MDRILIFMGDAGICPHCEVFSRHVWSDSVRAYEHDSGTLREIVRPSDLQLSICDHCNKYCLWQSEQLALPDAITVEQPNQDLPEEIQNDYLEAASVLSKSPKAAAALLRLCLQKLCKFLGENGTNINDDIKSLVQKGLPAAVQQAMDSIRVLGNNAVHPGEIDPNENKESVPMLFRFINVIAQAMITQPKEINVLYGTLPAGAKEAIQKRDSPKNTN